MTVLDNINTTFPDRFAVINLDNQDEFVLVESYLRFATEQEIRAALGANDANCIIEDYKGIIGVNLSDYETVIDGKIFLVKLNGVFHKFDIRLLKKEYIMVGEEKQEIINTESGDVMIEVDTEEEQVTIWDTDGDSITLSFDELEDVYGEYSDHIMLEEDDQIPY